MKIFTELYEHLIEVLLVVTVVAKNYAKCEMKIFKQLKFNVALVVGATVAAGVAVSKTKFIKKSTFCVKPNLRLYPQYE